ncbi:hypothetical protein LIT25_08410 [Bacillus sp. F19]|nr:hypothetical protein LIT25_08410 [Bacillus sp. F19]
MKHIRLAAFRRNQHNQDIYFLNTLEPKHEQLFFARLSIPDKKLLFICAYETKLDRFGDVTSLFTEEYIDGLNQFLAGYSSYPLSSQSG